MSLIIVATIAMNKGKRGNVFVENSDVPEDCRLQNFERFKSLVKGNVVVVGCKKFTAIQKDQPIEPRSVILFAHPGEYSNRHVMRSVRRVVRFAEDKRVVIAGGADIYQKFINCPEVTAVYLTRIFKDLVGNGSFPVFPYDQWDRCSYVSHGNFDFEMWVRKQAI